MAALTEILSSGTLAKLSVKQLLVEFHLWDDQHFSSFVRIISLLRQQGYEPFMRLPKRPQRGLAFGIASLVGYHHERETGIGKPPQGYCDPR